MNHLELGLKPNTHNNQYNYMTNNNLITQPQPTHLVT